MAKQFGYTASILKDSNRLIASSQIDWSPLKKGSYIIFDDDDDFYKVVDKNKFFYIKDFRVRKPNVIKIEGSTDIKLSLNDNITLTFKEYEASSVEILNGGTGYSQGDIVDINDGTPKISSYDGLTDVCKISVDEIGPKGEVTKVSILSTGAYYEHSEKPTTTNKGLSLRLEYALSEKRTMEDRAISNIKYDGKNTLIHLNSDLPVNVKVGKLSVDKWELILNINYVGGTKINSTYRVLVDFTPHLNIPLMKEDLNKNVAVFNEAISTIDKEIKKIWGKLGK